MQIDDLALEFLNSLEYAESALLIWGVVDGFFSEEEIRERAECFFDQASPQSKRQYESSVDVIEALLDTHLLIVLPHNNRYRTRMGETVRLFARLRQIFANANRDAWQTSPGLVADYRLSVRRRQFPIRSVTPDEALSQIGCDVNLSFLQTEIIKAFLGAGAAKERRAAGFQVRATNRILKLADQANAQGTVVSAGTGSGKTMAFYLPAFAAIGPHISDKFWVKCLALYPRNELLKDQLKEAISAARRVRPALKGAGRRALAVGALYGAIPNSSRDVTTGRNPWKKITFEGRRAYECPFLRCPACESHMCWTETDLTASIEKLHCVAESCGEVLDAEEIRLTRSRMRKEPPDILFTSTEMLNKRMGDSNFRVLFGINLPAERKPFLFLLDEVHTYEGTHGAHVALLLRRWKRASESRPHFVGLSATLADAPRFFADLVGLLPGAVTEISPVESEIQAVGAEYTLILRGDPTSGTSLLSTTIQALMLLRRVLASESSDEFGTKVFAFTDNLDVTNRLFHNLLDAEGLTALGTWNPNRPDGSLANLRASTLPQATPRWIAGQNWRLAEEIGHSLANGERLRVSRTSSQDLGVDRDADIVVATASLEVGFDDPEVGGVLQHKAPLSVSAYLQRKGRAGRRQSMRPWTVVVLSDFGRDRAAFQAYEQLFTPVIGVKYLPLTNVAVLKMQATFVLFDWLATKIPFSLFPNVWSDFSQPCEELSNAEWAAKAAEREAIYKKTLSALLEHKNLQDEFERFLSKSLTLGPEQIQTLLWESPRSLLLEAVPTLLRRLETHWKEGISTKTEPHKGGHPLPEFVPDTLFSDLQLPEVVINLPATNQGPRDPAGMPIANALKEFAPGRVSRRFGINSASEKYWISSEAGPELWIDSFCPENQRQNLGIFTYRSEAAQVINIQVFRPTAITVTNTPPSISQTSNSFLTWRTQIVPTDCGLDLEIADSRRWSGLLRKVEIHSHSLGLPLEVRRFTTGATSTVGRGKQTPVTTEHFFAAGLEDEDKEPVALGFAADVDGLLIEFSYPGDLLAAVAREPRLVRGLRPSRFRYLLSTDPALALSANGFQIDWLAQIYLSAIALSAIKNGYSLEAAVAREVAGDLAETIREIIDTIMRREEDVDGDDPPDHIDNGMPPAARVPKRLGEISDLMADASVKASLRSAAVALWEVPSEAWIPWLKTRFRATLGVAVLDTISSLCPRVGEGSLLLDLDPYVRNETALPDNDDEFWLTETTIGGAGVVEEFLSEYSKDPRRFLRILDSKLAASDLELTADQLTRSIYLAAESGDNGKALSQAFGHVRSAANHVESVTATEALRQTLSSVDIPPSISLMIALNGRVLHAGTSSDTDRFMADAIREWEATEERIGIDIDLRVYCIHKSSDEGLARVLGLRTSAATVQNESWRYSVLYGMLWSRGAQIRTEGLKAWSPFNAIPACDRLLVLAAIETSIRRVSIDQPEWFALFAEVVAKDGTVELACANTHPRLFSDALLLIGANPVDSETLLIFARLTGVRAESDQLIATFELPEAF